MKSILMLLLAVTLMAVTALPSQANVKRGDVIYHWTFSDPGADAGWQGLDNRSIGWSTTPPSGKALHIANPVDGAHNAAASIALDVAKVRGLRLAVSAKVKATDVVKPEHTWNGIKVALVSKSPSGDQYDQLPDVYGTFDWREIRFNSKVPENATSVTLVLAIENTSGSADFDDIRVTVLEAPVDAAAKPIPAAVGPSPSPASVPAGDSLYHWSFSDPGADVGWQGLDNRSVGWSASPPSLKALRIANPIDGAHNAAASIPLDIAKVRGLRLAVSAKVKATDVVKPEHTWNGVKVMLVSKSPSGDQYDQ